jgi:hypothetical protein
MIFFGNEVACKSDSQSNRDRENWESIDVKLNFRCPSHIAQPGGWDGYSYWQGQGPTRVYGIQLTPGPVLRNYQISTLTFILRLVRNVNTPLCVFSRVGLPEGQSRVVFSILGR